MVVELPAFPPPPVEPLPHLGRVAALVFVPASERRSEVGKALAAVGIRAVTEAATAAEARAACADSRFQLLVLEQEIGSPDAPRLLRDLRHGVQAGDPFVLAVLLLAARDEARVRAAIDSGPDDLLLVPFSVGQLISRINVLLERRKPFVVTHDYIGPDRRAAPRPGRAGLSAAQIAVPHPLRACATGVPAERYALTRAEGWRAIGVERIKRLAVAIEWESNAVLAKPEESAAGLARLDALAAELAARVTAVLELDAGAIDSLRQEVARLAALTGVPSRPELDALQAAAHRLAETYAAPVR